MTHSPVRLAIVIAALAGCLLYAQDSGTFLYEARQSYGKIAKNLLASAEEMPDESYSFRPTPESPRFSQLIQDIAASQTKVCSAIVGKSIQYDGAISPSKVDLVEALRASIRTCDSAYGTVNSFNADQMVGLGTARHSRLAWLSLNSNHADEVYGTLTVYLRLKGLVPPSSRARLIPVD